MENEQQIYRHDHGDGVVHTHELEPDHTHEHEHTHSHEGDHIHHHDHAQTKAVINRLARAIGHLESVKRMVEEGRDCTEVLVQLAAVRSALNSTAKIILKDHIEHCIVQRRGAALLFFALLNVFLGKIIQHAKAHLPRLRDGEPGDADAVKARGQAGLGVEARILRRLALLVLFAHEKHLPVQAVCPQGGAFMRDTFQAPFRKGRYH